MNIDIAQFIENQFGCKMNCIRRIVDGHSTAEKYEIHVDTQRYFVRLLPYDSDLEEKYLLLMEAGKSVPEICEPAHVWHKSGTLIILTDWFYGIPLDQYCSANSTMPQFDIAKRVGNALRRFHTRTECNADRVLNKFSIEQFSAFVCNYLPTKYPIHATMDLVENLYRTGPYSLIHYDLRPANVLLNEAGELRIIDFEYMDFMPAYMDLSICLLFSPRFQKYGQGLIEGYFDGPPPTAFWEQQQHLLIHEIIRYSRNPRNSETDVRKKLQQALEVIKSNRPIAQE